MPIEQQGNAITFYAFFTESKVGKTGLTVTLDVYRNDTEIVTAGSATEVGDGLYKYQLAAGSVNAEGHYIAVFKTATTTVDYQHIPALWVIDKAGVEHLDDGLARASARERRRSQPGRVRRVLGRTARAMPGALSATPLRHVRVRRRVRRVVGAIDPYEP